MAPPAARTLPEVCGRDRVFETVVGTGTVYSFIVQRQPSVVGYEDTIPYVVALVDLDDAPGVRLPARIVGIEPESITVDMRVDGRVRGTPRR